MRLFSQRGGRRTGVRAQLRSIRSPDVPDLFTWAPTGSFSVVIELVIGPEGEPGEESFALTLCTPDQLAREASKEGITDGRHHFVVERYDFASFERYLRRRVEACEGESWDEVAAKLARIARSEFEDYVE